MSDLRNLRLSVPSSQLGNLDVTELLWGADSSRSSFHVDVGPRLLELGPVPKRHVDLVHLAVAVYIADRTCPRPHDWEREIELRVPVSDPDAWNAQAPALQALLSYLSGDDWALQFRARRWGQQARRSLRTVRGDAPVLLFSGGADSLAGSILTTESAGRPPVLSSHWDSTLTSGAQGELIRKLRKLWGSSPVHVRVRVGRKTKQYFSKGQFPQEPSSRSRSLLFIALGLAAAEVRRTHLVIAENGFASLNVPLAAERRSSLSTRTTHPALLDGLALVLANLGINTQFSNPYEQLTKGEMFRAAADVLGDVDLAADLLSTSHSCATPNAQYSGYRPDAHCGACFGCLVRRAGFAASGIEDRTFYIEQDLRGRPTPRADYMTPTKRETYEAVRYRVDRGISDADILALGLPPRVDEDDALAVAQRGLAELALIDIP